MVQPTHQGLKYGVIYIYFDPEVKAAFGSYQAAGVIGKIAHPFKIEWVPEHGRGHDNTLLVARRFNVGNMGRYATVSLRTSDDNPHGVQFDALHKFRDLLFKIEDGEDGDIALERRRCPLRLSHRLLLRTRHAWNLATEDCGAG